MILPMPNEPATHDAAPKADEMAAYGDATNATMRRLHWAHHVAVGAIHSGVPSDWLTENFASRMVVWFNVGETVRGAVDMLVFSWRQSRVEERTGREMAFLRAAVAGGAR